MSKYDKKEISKGSEGVEVQEIQFKCLNKFAPLDEYVYEIEHGKNANSDEQNKEQSAEDNKSEWYKCAEEILNSEKNKAKEIPDVTFDELLEYWMRQGM